MTKLVGYEWRTESGEKFSAYDGGLVPCKVSDWSQAEKSQLSGRTIVHIYWIEKDGKLLPYGKDSALKELGIKQGTLKKMADQYMAKAHKDAENYKWFLKAIEMGEKYSSVQASNGWYKRVNYSPMHPKGKDYLAGTACFHRNGEYVTFMDIESNVKALTELGFTKVI